MKYRIIKNPLKYKLYEYVVMILFIMATDSIWFRINVNPYNYYFIVVIASILALLVLANLKIFTKKSGFKLVCLMLIGVLIAALINIDTNFFIFYKIALIVIGLYLFIKWNISKIADIYVSVIVLIAIFSLLGVINSNFILNNPIFPTLSDGEYGTKTAFFYNIRLGWDDISYYRNQGPFWEPGAFQAYLNVGVFFIAFLLKRKHKQLEIIILSAAILSTFSTTGIITLCLLFLTMMIESGKKAWGNKLLYFSLSCVVVGLCIFNNDINERLFDKFGDSTTSSISSETRKVSILINLKVIEQNPFIGMGISKGSSLYSSISTLNSTIDANVNTATSLFAWAIFGVMYAVLYTYSYIKIAVVSVNRWLSKFLLISVFFIILNTEDWTYSFWFNILPIYGLMLLNFPKDKNKI
ncbi:hypothetical protein ABES25_16890 [Bacillus gobiensis]|uniref:hypothetical protein n=1 Tax=Bacillus gobiensis TaxID=1441095 RepID=UPI003D20EB3D